MGGSKYKQGRQLALKLFKILKMPLNYFQNCIFFTYHPSKILELPFNFSKLHVVFTYRPLKEKLYGSTIEPTF